MQPSVYLETSIISYLTSRPSRDIVSAARQQITQMWWDSRRQAFDLYISSFVVEEAEQGDAVAARRRIEVVHKIPQLELVNSVRDLARSLVRNGPLPEQAALDAFHISIAAVHKVDYLLSWNMRHIANAALRTRIEKVCQSHGFEPPIMCTPEELIDDDVP